MKKLLLLTFTILSVYFGQLHAQKYNFSVNNAAFNFLENGISVNEGYTWDDPYLAIPIGFDFRVGEQTFDSLYFSDIGSVAH